MLVFAVLSRRDVQVALRHRTEDQSKDWSGGRRRSKQRCGYCSNRSILGNKNIACVQEGLAGVELGLQKKGGVRVGGLVGKVWIGGARNFHKKVENATWTDQFNEEFIKHV